MSHDPITPPIQRRSPAATPRAPNEPLEHWLTRVERDQSFPNQRPRDAATIILLDRSSGVPKVLLGRRHHGHKFLPGKFVFPGGRVEPEDGAMPVARALDPAMETHLMRRTQRPSSTRARALAVAAVREACEETGLLLGRRADGVAVPERGVWRSFAAAGVVPDLSQLHFIARAITPPRRPRRFDTRFFVADSGAIAHRVEGIVGPDTELVELVWMPLAEASELDMLTITRVALIELQARIAAGLRHDLPVPFYHMVRGRFRRELV
jgi:8-oxo-dGTP pyrophosphatase MutT (NUDIX family)